LHGVIYLHRISDIRMGGNSKRTLELLMKICGRHTLKNLVIMTTMWGRVNLDSDEAKMRETELFGFFQPAFDDGASYFRHKGTQEAALGVIRRLMKNTPMALMIQTELVDERKHISNTDAGKEIRRHLDQTIQRKADYTETLSREVVNTRTVGDTQTLEELEDELLQSGAELLKLQRQMDNLLAPSVHMGLGGAHYHPKLSFRKYLCMG
jgi:hypothetical protein